MPPQVITEAFPEHQILGEEGGLSGGTESNYLWCVDPLDGTTNFAHGYPNFGVSVAGLAASPSALQKAVVHVKLGLERVWTSMIFIASIHWMITACYGSGSNCIMSAVLEHGVPEAACVVEFAGGNGSWVQRTYTATRRGGANLDGRALTVSPTDELQRSLLVRGGVAAEAMAAVVPVTISICSLSL